MRATIVLISIKMTEDKSLNKVNERFEEFLKSLTPEHDKKLLRKAFEFSKKAHIYQKRTSGEPFIAHPVEVCKLVAELGMDDASIISALLHDVVEDTEYNLTHIKELFGDEVERIVDGLTKITDFGRKKEDVQIDALRKVLLASAKDIRILIIKLCDRLHNMRTLKELKSDKKIRVAKETILIYVPIAQKIGLYSLKWELEDLAFKYMNPEMYSFVSEKINMKRTQREQIVNKAVKEIKEVLELNDVEGVNVLGRPKNFYSIYKKIKNKAKTFEDIFDLYAIRIIAKDISQCYTILGVLHDQFQAFPDRLKDYIATPKFNGYQSIHSVIFSRAIKAPVEIQIRTEDMHKLAEFGVAAHWRYKNIKEDKKFEKKIGWLREVLQWENEHKDNEEFLKILKFDFFEDEIFAFTPKNDVIVLPERASALDFAYAVHTDIGHKAYKAKINGSITSIDKEVKSGDIVEIVTQKSVKPSEKWLKFVKTNKAKLKIRAAIQLKHSGKQNVEVDDQMFSKLLDKITRVEEYKKVRKGGCCKIDYGDQIIGVSSGKAKAKELVVHNASCDNAKYTLNPKVQLRWKEEKEKEVTLTLILKDRIGLLMDILNTFSKKNVNILSVNSKTMKNGDAKMTVTLLDGEYLDDLVNKLKKLDSIENIKVNRGLFNF